MLLSFKPRISNVLCLTLLILILSLASDELLIHIPDLLGGDFSSSDLQEASIQRPILNKIMFLVLLTCTIVLMIKDIRKEN